MPPYKPYTSQKQEAWAHTPTGRAKLGADDVAGKDKASKGLRLPKRSAGGRKLREKAGRRGK